MTQRRAIESTGDHAGDAAWEQVAEALSDDDRFLRYAARRALERGGESAWAVVAQRADERAGSEINLALGRTQAEGMSIGRKLGAICDSPVSASVDETVAMLRAVELVLSRDGEPDAESRDLMLRRFDSAYPAEDPRLHRLLTEVLTSLRAPNIGTRLLDSIESAASREEGVYAAHSLRLVADQLTDDERTRYFTWLHCPHTIPRSMSLA